MDYLEMGFLATLGVLGAWIALSLVGMMLGVVVIAVIGLVHR